MVGACPKKIRNGKSRRRSKSPDAGDADQKKPLRGRVEGAKCADRGRRMPRSNKKMNMMRKKKKNQRGDEEEDGVMLIYYNEKTQKGSVGDALMTSY